MHLLLLFSHIQCVSEKSQQQDGARRRARNKTRKEKSGRRASRHFILAGILLLLFFFFFLPANFGGSFHNRVRNVHTMVFFFCRLSVVFLDSFCSSFRSTINK